MGTENSTCSDNFYVIFIVCLVCSIAGGIGLSRTFVQFHNTFLQPIIKPECMFIGIVEFIIFLVSLCLLDVFNIFKSFVCCIHIVIFYSKMLKKPCFSFAQYKKLLNLYRGLAITEAITGVIVMVCELALAQLLVTKLPVNVNNACLNVISTILALINASVAISLFLSRQYQFKTFITEGKLVVLEHIVEFDRPFLKAETNWCPSDLIFSTEKSRKNIIYSSFVGMEKALKYGGIIRVDDENVLVPNIVIFRNKSLLRKNQPKNIKNIKDIGIKKEIEIPSNLEINKQLVDLKSVESNEGKVEIVPNGSNNNNYLFTNLNETWPITVVEADVISTIDKNNINTRVDFENINEVKYIDSNRIEDIDAIRGKSSFSFNILMNEDSGVDDLKTLTIEDIEKNDKEKFLNTPTSHYRSRAVSLFKLDEADLPLMICHTNSNDNGVINNTVKRGYPPSRLQVKMTYNAEDACDTDMELSQKEINHELIPIDSINKINSGKSKHPIIIDSIDNIDVDRIKEKAKEIILSSKEDKIGRELNNKLILNNNNNKNENTVKTIGKNIEEKKMAIFMSPTPLKKCLETSINKDIVKQPGKLNNSVIEPLAWNTSKSVLTNETEIYVKSYILVKCSSISKTLPRQHISVERFKLSIQKNFTLYRRLSISRFWVNSLIQNQNARIIFKIRRDPQFFLDDFTNIVLKCNKRALIYPIYVEFDKERGIDLGGLRQELICEVAKHFFNPKNGCVIQNNETGEFSISPACSPERAFALGFLIAKCIYHGIPLSFILTKLMCHLLLNIKPKLETSSIMDYSNDITLSDISDFDNGLANLLTCAEYDDEYYDILRYESFEPMPEYGLTSDYIEKCIKNSTKEIIIDNYTYDKSKQVSYPTSIPPLTVKAISKHPILMLKHYSSIINKKGKFNPIIMMARGFNFTLPKPASSFLTPTDIQMIVSGSPEIDVSDWKKYTVLTDSMKTDLGEKALEVFWEMLEDEVEMRSEVLSYVTGLVTPPFGGFKYLGAPQFEGEKPKPFEINAIRADLLPIAHTCVNSLDLPLCINKNEMTRKFKIAIKSGREMEII